MATRARKRTVTYPQSNNQTIVLYDDYENWAKSPTLGGILQLRANVLSRSKQRNLDFRPFGLMPQASADLDAVFPIAYGNPLLNEAEKSCLAESYGRLRGRLYKGSAALGVTMASWRQSREMIVNRYRQMSLQADSFERRANSVFRMRKGRKQALALDKLSSQYLEMVFGWQPLLQDIVASCRTVIQGADPLPFVSGSARTAIQSTRVTSATKAYYNVRQFSGFVRVKRTTQVRVSNPNRWLKERAGLLNPASVAWDLVPWSFVVNMFVNTGQLVNSISDFAGLTFQNGSTTSRKSLTCHQFCVRTSGTSSYGGSAANSFDTKYRTLGAVERPPLVFKMPNVSWELAAIAASLFLQKFRSIERLVNFTIK